MTGERGRGEHRWTPTNQEMVGALRAQYPEVMTGKMAVREIFRAFPEIDDVEFACVPDGVVIDKDARRVDIFEAEVTHPIPRTTMRALCNLWSACDFFDIELNLFVVNRYGHINQLDVGAWWLTLLKDDLETTQ